MKNYHRPFLVVVITCAISMMLFISFGEARNIEAKSTRKASSLKPATVATSTPQKASAPEVFWSEATAFAVTPALADLQPEMPELSTAVKFRQRQEAQEKNPANTKRIRPEIDPSRTEDFIDPTLAFARLSRSVSPSVVTNPLVNFDGPDADLLPGLFGNRFAPPDTNAAVGPNHVVITTNSMVQVFSKAGVAAGPAIRISQLLVGIPNAADDDGDPIILYDPLANRWFISQFNVRFDAQNRMAMHVAVSTTPDPTGTWFAYEFKCNPGRLTDYPHVGVWPDGYYMASNDFNTLGTAFLGAGFYAMERAKMLSGDPTAKMIGINSATANDGGFLPTNLQGFIAPPAGTPNLFIEWFADEFGPEGDILRPFVLTPNYANPPASTLVQLADMPVAPFDARNPAGRADIAQPAPGEGLDGIADRLMHAMNFRILPGGVQSYVLNWTVNVSGVNPTSAALYQAGVRWMELRRNPGSGAITINQQATYAPGSGDPVGRDLWMASVAQDGEGNIGLAANASQIAAPALNPTAIYTGRLASDPPNTTPQGEVDALAAVTRGVQTATSNRWGDYSSLFVDPADECTFWGAFEYVDSPTATFDWNTRVFSFKVNPQCATPQRGTLVVNVTNCASGLPVAGASVAIDGNLWGVTGAGGSGSFTLASGSYSVQVSKAGFATPAAVPVVITNGQTTTINVCLVGVPIIAPAGTTIVAESCVPANAAIDPGETVTVSFCVQNTGTANTTNLVGTLQATGGVVNPSGPQNYGVVVAGGPAVCRNFTFTANGTCGGTITASLQLQDGATNLGTVTYTLQIGGAGAPVTANYSTGNIAVPIPDVSTVEVPINIADTGLVDDVNVRVRLNHTFDGDLQLRLIHPDGTAILLSNNRGGSGQNFGTGTNDCAGTPTIFDDSAATAISAGVAPFAGTFRPETPLSGLNGKPITGMWKLRVSDTAALDVGTIGCVTLEIRRFRFVCCGIPGTPEIRAGASALINESCPPENEAIDPGERVTVNLTLENVGDGATSNLVATLQSSGGVNAPSGPQTYGVITPTGPGSSVTRDFSFTATGSCGGSITATWQLQDGATNLGTVTKTYQLGATVNNVTTFSNPAAITILDTPRIGGIAPASPYPSTINVAGVVGPVTKVTATLRGLSHTFPGDIDILLVGPGGQKMMLMSDVGGGTDVVNATLTFDDTAPAIGATVVSGTFRPTNLGTGDVFPAPAPAGPYPDPQLLSVFNGVNPNGTWSLYVVDDAGIDAGAIAQGWELNITTSQVVCTVPCGIVRLLVNASLSCVSPGTVKATYQITNTGTAAASNVMLTSAQLGAVNGTPLPQVVGNIPAFGTSSSFDVFFTPSPPPGMSTLILGGTKNGGSFSSTRRVTVPACTTAPSAAQKN